MSGADLRGADIAYATFPNTNLQLIGVEGIENAIFLFTIYDEKTQFPESLQNLSEGELARKGFILKGY